MPPRIPRLITWSGRIYRLLLKMYPGPFKRAYSAQMAQIFRDLCLDSYNRAGIRGLLWLWLHVLADLVVNVLAETVAQRQLKSITLAKAWPELEVRPMTNGHSRNNSSLQYSLIFGGILGVILAIYLLLPDFSKLGVSFFGYLASGVMWCSLLILTCLAGLTSAQSSKRLNAAIQAGLLTAFVGIMIFHLTRITYTLVSFDALSKHASEDQDFIRRGLSDYGAFVIDDILGGIVFSTPLFCFLGAALGAVGGLLGRQTPSRPVEM